MHPVLDVINLINGKSKMIENFEKKAKLDDVWVEKYRPDSFEGIVGQDEIVNAISEAIEKGNLSNLIFEGKAGTGKTTMAKAIANKLDADFMELNSSEERGIEVVRGKITTFVRHLSFNGKQIKICFLDEADSMTTEAQMCLRPIMEKYTRNCRFIIGCNYVDKIIAPVKESRCKVYRFKPIDKNAVLKRLLYIAEKENIFVSMSEKDRALAELSERCRGDMRKAINDLQMGDYGLSETEKIFSI